MLLELLLFEKKKTENIRPSKNADCTECSNVLYIIENGAKIAVANSEKWLCTCR